MESCTSNLLQTEPGTDGFSPSYLFKNPGKITESKVLESNSKEEPVLEFRTPVFDSATPFEILMIEELSDVNLIIRGNIIAVHKLIHAQPNL